MEAFFHDLRHSHASALIAQGWDVEEVSSRLGHADVAITQQTYVHAFDPRSAAATGVAVSQLSTSLSTSPPRHP